MSSRFCLSPSCLQPLFGAVPFCPFCGTLVAQESALPKAEAAAEAKADAQDCAQVRAGFSEPGGAMPVVAPATQVPGPVPVAPEQSKARRRWLIAALVLGLSGLYAWDRQTQKQRSCAERLSLIEDGISRARFDWALSQIVAGQQCGDRWVDEAKRSLTGAIEQEAALGCADLLSRVEAYLSSSRLETAETTFNRMSNSCRTSSPGNQLGTALERTRAAANMAEIQVRRHLAQNNTVAAAAQFNQLLVFNREQAGIEALRAQVMRSADANTTRPAGASRSSTTPQKQ